jgi:hypothetical protein
MNAPPSTFCCVSRGERFWVDLRQELLPTLKTNQPLQALEAELENLFSTLLDVAFSELHLISRD